MTSLTSFITTIDGRRCTAVPRVAVNTFQSNINIGTSATSTTESISQSTVAVETSTVEEVNITTATVVSTSLDETTTSSNEPAFTSASQQVEAPAVVPPAAALPTSSPEFQNPLPPPATTENLSPVTDIAITSETSLPPPPLPPAESSSQVQTEVPAAATTSSQTDAAQLVPTADARVEDTSTLPGELLPPTQTQQGTTLPDETLLTALPTITTPTSLSATTTTSSPVLFTTIGTAVRSSNIAAAQASGMVPSANGAVNTVPAPNNNAVQSTVAIAGGIIGGVVAMSMLALFFWVWRRRQFKKRRSTLLTPLDVTGSSKHGFNREDEKLPYVINRGSIGPTPRTDRFKAALGYNVRKLHGRVSRIISRGSTGTSVNMNRGNSQFIKSNTLSRNRADSSSSGTGYPTGAGDHDLSAKERLVDWWTQFKADLSFNRRLRNTKTPTADTFSSVRGIKNEKLPTTQPTTILSPPHRQPSFLTLLNTDDDRTMDLETQRRRVQKNTGSQSSSSRLMGGLNLDFTTNTNPFSDTNAITHASAIPAPLTLPIPITTNNPFSDAAAISNPNTYVASMRRSRGQSVSATTTANKSRPPSTTRAPSTIYDNRDSVDSFATRRNKFRSDPFDLEHLGSQGGSFSSSTAGTAGSVNDKEEVRKPAGAHVRRDSITSSRYSSVGLGLGLGEWADPGPDVGPAGIGVGRAGSGRSGKSQGSVGKAM